MQSNNIRGTKRGDILSNAWRGKPSVSEVTAGVWFSLQEKKVKRLHI